MTEDTEQTMDFERFETLLDQLGGDIAAWPEELRFGAERLLAADRAAMALQAGALAAERAIAGAPSVRASPELMARVLSDAPHARRSRKFGDVISGFWPFGSVWRPTAAMAVAVILGVLTGYTAPLPWGGSNVSAGDDLTAISYSLDQGLEDLE